MVAGDREHAVLGAQLRERRDVVAQVGDRAVDEVAGERDEVRREPVRVIDDALDERAIDREPDVEIGELDDREAVERARQLRRAVTSTSTTSCVAARLDHAARHASPGHGGGGTAGDPREEQPPRQGRRRLRRRGAAGAAGPPRDQARRVDRDERDEHQARRAPSTASRPSRASPTARAPTGAARRS